MYTSYYRNNANAPECSAEKYAEKQKIDNMCSNTLQSIQYLKEIITKLDSKDKSMQICTNDLLAANQAIQKSANETAKSLSDPILKLQEIANVIDSTQIIEEEAETVAEPQKKINAEGIHLVPEPILWRTEKFGIQFTFNNDPPYTINGMFQPLEADNFSKSFKHSDFIKTLKGRSYNEVLCLTKWKLDTLMDLVRDSPNITYDQMVPLLSVLNSDNCISSTFKPKEIVRDMSICIGLVKVVAEALNCKVSAACIELLQRATDKSSIVTENLNTDLIEEDEDPLT